MLWQNLASSKRFFDDFITTENRSLVHLTFVEWIRLSYMIAVCGKVVFCQVGQQSSPGEDTSCNAIHSLSLPHHHQSRWDVLSAARKADFQRIGGLIGDKIRLVARESGKEDLKKDAMAQYEHCMRIIMSSYDRQLQVVSIQTQEKGVSATARLDTAPWNVPETGPPTSQLSINGTSIPSDLGWDVPMDLQTESFEDVMWESLMQDFTTFPQQ